MTDITPSRYTSETSIDVTIPTLVDGTYSIDVTNSSGLGSGAFIVGGVSESISINTSSTLININTLEQWCGVTGAACDPMPNQYFNYNGSCYNNEKKLYDQTTSEALDMNGVKCDYYVVDHSEDNEKLWGEDNDKHIIQQYKLKVYFETPPEVRQYTQFGIEDVDSFQMYCTKMMFNKYASGYVPKFGDFIRPHYNGVLYEITDVIDTDEQFLNTQHNWKFTVKVWENNMLTTTPAISAEQSETYDEQDITPIKVYTTSGSDTLKQNDLIEEEKTNVLYNDIDNPTYNPYGDW
jgi:hypothetical protein